MSAAPSPSLGGCSSPLSDGVTVSRMGPIRRQGSGSTKKVVPRKRFNDVMYAPEPIEDVLRQRQALQPSRSAPVLRPETERKPLLLPRISVARKLPSDSTAAAFDHDLSREELVPKEPASDQESWLSMLNGGRQVGIPFSTLGEPRIHTDVFVHWYRSEQWRAQRQHIPQSGAAEHDASKPPLAELWARAQDEAAAELRTVSKGSGQALHLKAKLGMYRHLEDLGPGALRPGTGALRPALIYKLGSKHEVYRLLNVNGSGELSLMEFAGCMAVLGLDTEFLCGCDEQTLFQSLDHDRRGLIKVRDLLGAQPPSEQPNPEVAALDAKTLAKWVFIAKWMAVAARRSAALRERRIQRGWQVTDEGDSPTDQGEAAELVAEARLTDETSTGSDTPIHSPRTSASADEVLSEMAEALRKHDKRLRAMFQMTSSMKLENGMLSVGRTDVHRFFSDLRFADAIRSKAAEVEVIDRRYHETLALQYSYIKMRNGLVYWSLKAFLNNITKDLGLGWPGLVQRTIDSAEDKP